jgi:hypothetical protein
MSSNESRPPGHRPRKLVLRKIPTAGPLPDVRPPQRSIPFFDSAESFADAEAAAAITTSPSRVGPLPVSPLPAPPMAARPLPVSPVPPAGLPMAEAPIRSPRPAAATVLPQVQELAAVVRARWPSQVPIAESDPRATVAPVVAPPSSAGLPLDAQGPRRSIWARVARASTRASTLRAVGACLVGIALFAALGVEVGERSSHPAPASAAMQPVSAETKSVVSVVTPAQRPDPLPASSVDPSKLAAASVAPMPMVEVVKPTTIEAPPIAHAAPVAASPTKAPPPASSGATSGGVIAAAPAKQTTAASAATPADGPTKDVVQAGEEAASAPVAPEIPPSPAPTVDPLVQAVREDIREDEARRK